MIVTDTPVITPNPVQSGSAVVTIERPGFFRQDDSYLAGGLASEPFSALSDAIAAAQSVVNRSTQSMFVVESGANFVLRGAEAVQHVQGVNYGVRPARIPALEPRDTISWAHPGLAAIVLAEGTYDLTK